MIHRKKTDLAVFTLHIIFLMKTLQKRGGSIIPTGMHIYDYETLLTFSQQSA